MSGENNLDTLLKNMHPELQEGPFVFLTSEEDVEEEIREKSVMMFREQEGMTAIVSEDLARSLKKK